jgi:hypothetical protein
MLIDVAERFRLPLTFTDNKGIEYSSYMDGEEPYTYIPTPPGFSNIRLGKEWDDKEEYLSAVSARIGTEALWKRNLAPDKNYIEVGDLMINFRTRQKLDPGASAIAHGPVTREVVVMHHTSLVLAVYPPGVPHPRLKSGELSRTPDFPGDEKAIAQKGTVEYVRGTILKEEDDEVLEIDRNPDKDYHVDYLNYRSKRKDAAEIIYFANVRQLRADGFQFRFYGNSVFQ